MKLPLVRSSSLIRDSEMVTPPGKLTTASDPFIEMICPLQSGPKVNLDWTLKETEHGQEARA